MSFGLGDVDIIELDTAELGSTQSQSNESIPPPASTSGGGLEMLMNTTHRSTPETKSVNVLNDIDDLENELNDLSDTIQDPIGKSNTKSSLFNIDPPSDEIPVHKESAPHINIGVASSSTSDNRTWDGFGTFNDIPVNPNMDESVSVQQKMSKEEELREKFSYLRKLEGLEQKGVSLSKKYSMDSDLAEMQGEYEMIISEKEQSNSVKFQGKMLMAAVTGLEFLNNKVDPFDVNLDGWGEQVNENISDYDEIFAELHEKYKSKAKIAPELKLMFQLGGSAIMVHMTNSIFKTSVPGMDDIMRQNPDLMKQFSQAAVNSMGATNPGLSGFMNDMSKPSQPQQQPPQRPPQRQSQPPSNSFGQGVSINDNFAPVNEPSKRVEMKGPSDISSILSNIKKKQTKQPSQQNNIEVGSTISIQELTEMQKDMGGSNGRRRPKSERNTISLDI